MNITEVPINELKEYARNPRKNDASVEYVANSIREFGFKIPVVIDQGNTIVCGHTRVKAARNIGMKTVPCIIADDLTDEQIKAFRLADNKTAEFAEWDFTKLDVELMQIQGLDMQDFGFDFSEMPDVLIEKKELKPYEKVFYLIACDVNLHDVVLPFINELREINGVEIDSSFK